MSLDTFGPHPIDKGCKGQDPLQEALARLYSATPRAAYG